jgi:dTDP-4-dehydrorhamnose 3,5-epimerase
MQPLLQILTAKDVHKPGIIHDMVVRPLRVNRDARGTLTEGMKTTWDDVYHEQRLPFAQMYFSSTEPGVARDEGLWHYHPGGQQDRFGVIRGDIVVAVFDDRDGSKSRGSLNLFHMGESLGDEGQYLLLIPERTYHGYVVVGKHKATMFNFPTRLYDPNEEKRIPMQDSPLADGSIFSYETVKKLFL